MAAKETFSKRRMYRLFRASGRSFIVALDHALGMDVHPQLARPEVILDQVVQGGADAVLTSFGIAKSFPDHLRDLGVILRADGGPSQLGGATTPRLILSVEEALAIGADAVACMLFPGSDEETLTFQNVSSLASECSRWGMPLLVEAVPGGFSNSKMHTSPNIRLAVRIAAELGADLVKTVYPGSRSALQEIVESCYCPVVVLGGGRTDPDRLLSTVADALGAGAAGVAFGRNVWQHPSPQKLVAAISMLIHENASLTEAGARLK